MPNHAHSNSQNRQHASRPPPSDVALIIQALSPKLSDATLPSIDRFAPQKPPAADAVDQAFDQIVLKLIPALNAHLQALPKDFGPDGNAELVKTLNRLVRRLGGKWGFRCTACGEHATSLRWGHSGQRERYFFRFEHSDKKRHGASATLPLLELMQAADRMSRS